MLVKNKCVIAHNMKTHQQDNKKKKKKEKRKGELTNTISNQFIWKLDNQKTCILKNQITLQQQVNKSRSISNILRQDT